MDNVNIIVTILSIIVTSVSIIFAILQEMSMSSAFVICGIVFMLLVIFVSTQRPPQPPTIHIDQVEITILNGQYDDQNMRIKQ